MQTVRELSHDQDRAVVQSSQAPKSFAEGVEQYLLKRREQLIGQFGDTESTFEVERISARIGALAAIARAADGSMPDRQWRRAPRPGKSSPDHAIHLARVMCPDDWENTVLPKFAKVADEAAESLVGKIETEQNLALLLETQRFIRTLRAIESEAKRVLSKRNHNANLRRIANG
tara:strand:- start:195 stop:716 length:522 start_codon:yes stop_codon:yes gene_type:complete